MPEVSVIMGVYNCKNFKLLNESVQSIIDQTYTDWEFIICNDGSTDNTLDELKKISQLDERIKILSYDQNKGLETALNTCLKEATGKYIARQDDDDISYPDRFEKEIDFLKNNPKYSWVGTIAKVYDDEGIYGTYKLVEKPEKKTFLWASPFLHPSVIFRKEALDACNGYRIGKELKRCEDYDLFMRMYAAGMIGYNMQEELYQYKVVRNNKKAYRPMKDRINEAKVRHYGFKKMGIGFRGIPYILKPIIIGLIPRAVFNKIIEKKYSDK